MLTVKDGRQVTPGSPGLCRTGLENPVSPWPALPVLSPSKCSHERRCA
jgi:hypothetical protein